MAEVPVTETPNSGPIRRARASLAALETLQRLRRVPHTRPTPDDLDALRGWSGWGPLAPALERTRAGSWKEIGERIAFLLPGEDYDHGVQATYNAFYTPPEIAAACWQILTGLGFAGGQILEPGCGAGAFMAATPGEISTTWTGVERDPTTAAIAGLLHPDATIHACRLEETPLASFGVDAVLGNVPFGDTKIYDPTAPRELTANLHNYFIYRSVRALRPGGVAVLVTSRYTMDAAGDAGRTARTLLCREAELLGALRLPNDALTSGGAEPLVDVLVLRRRRRGEGFVPDQNEWISTGPSVGGQQVNTYFLTNPQMVLGELAEDSAPRWGRTLRVDARPDDPPVEVAMAAGGREIVRQATEADRVWRVDAGATPITVETAPFKLRADGKKEGSFHLVGGSVHEVVEGELVAVVRPGKELPKLVALRDAVLSLLDAESDHTRPDEQLAPLRTSASMLYDAYVKAHGFLNRYTVVEGKPDEDGAVTASRRRPSMGGFRRDPDFVTVLALEDFDDDTCSATKAALLTRRVNRPRRRATSAATAAEAIALCRDELGRFDFERVVELLGTDQAEAERQLADVAFIDPETDSWVPADEYLAGNVRLKLARAKVAVGLDAERFASNVPALESVVPADLEPEQIEANLGAPWIPATDVREFAAELLSFPVNVWHEPRTNTWSVTASRRAEQSAAATTEWDTDRLNAYQLLEYGLNGKAPVVYDFVDDKRVRNQDETIAANDRLDAIAGRFANWWREDPDRADRLTHDYNQTYNAIVPRKHSGAHLTFPGLDSEFEPYEHQRDMVARMISGNDALCPYPVGTGKTATMFMAAIKLKALGLASKPLIIVVPSTLEQIARDGKRLFPNARILMAGKEDLANPRARKLFAARCAMEEWDAVVMSHPSFTSLPVHPTVKADYLTTLAADYRSALIAAKADGAEPRKIKQIAKMVDRQEAEAKALLSHATDDGVFFEHLGTDYLLVDEMHYFKNLDVPVHTDGFTINGSKRAQDLDMKLSWQRKQHPDQAVVTGFTGTPVSNTLLELFILQHYLQPQRLEQLGLSSADAWASLFVRFATGVEITPDGGFRLNRRPAEIINIPDLMQTVAEFAELRAPEAFPVTRPDAYRHLEVIDASDAVRDYVHNLAERADDIRAGGVPTSVDNMLKICSDGRKVALHESLVGLEPEGAGKVGKVAANVSRIYHETENLELPGDESHVRGRLQLVFCDLGTPNKDKGNQVYGLIRQELIAAGVPATHIRFIHEATTDAQRLVLFDQCNKGDISVLLGSTDKLGVGVNVQRRAVAVHHVDAPWRPDQVEQREGRVWRPKNLNPKVDLYRYVTKDSFDAFMWQTLERKEKSLRPFLSGQVTARSVEDIGDIALDYGQIKAVATGNPMLAELNELNVRVKTFASLAAGHRRNQRRLRADIQTFTMQAAAAETTAEALEAVARATESHPSDTSWLDARLKPLSADDVPAILGTLAESTIARGYCDGEVHWRGGLSIDFTYSKNRHDGALSARIIVGDNRHRVDVPLNVAWAAKGQHWRIRDTIAAAVKDARQTAAETRANIETLGQRIVENEASIGQPFAEQAAFDEARTRRAVLDAAIREHAQKDEEARRNRAARALTGTAAVGTEAQRKALLRRLHVGMSAIIQRAETAALASSKPVLGEAVSPAAAAEVEPSDARFTMNPGSKVLHEETPLGGNVAAPPTPQEQQNPPVRIERASPPEKNAPLESAATPVQQERPEMFEHAVDLALRGFAVFPLKPGTKRPMFKGWETLASTDPQQIAQWWNANPRANIAIACGPSNLLVIDLDKAKKPRGPRHGQETLTSLAAGREIPRTFTVASARGGRHLYFRQPDGIALTISTGSETAGLGPLIDTRGHGGFIVAPGSVFEGRSYRIEDEATIAPLPDWLAKELTKYRAPAESTPTPTPSNEPVTDRRRDAYGNAALNRSTEAVATAPEGTRNDTLNREAFRLGRLVGGGILDQGTVVAELRKAAHRAGLPPAEATNTITSGLKAGSNQPRTIPDRTPLPPAPKETAMTAVSEHDEHAAPQTATSPPAPPDVAPVHAIEPEAEKQAAAIGPKTVKAPHQPSVTSVQQELPLAPEPDSDFQATWNKLRASIDRGRQQFPEWTELNSIDDLKPAIEEVLRYLSQAPIDQSPGTAEPDSGNPAQDLDEHLAAVDAAYFEAQATGIPADRPEWSGISSIHSAIHNLWDTMRGVAGTYWAELSADVHVRGVLTTLAIRSTRAIASLANAAATHLELRGVDQKPTVAPNEPSLREAYINARQQVRAHAAAHEWQRITALWGTINTLTRQAGDPGIRAVVARSADAISDYAESLGRKSGQYGHGSAVDALRTLAAAAERHAAALRARDADDETPNPGPCTDLATADPGQPPADTGVDQCAAAALQLQARARQVAQHAETRLGRTPQRIATAGQRSAHDAGKTRSPSSPMPPTPPNSPSSPGVHLR